MSVIVYIKKGFKISDKKYFLADKLIYCVNFKLALEGFRGYPVLVGRFEDYSWKAVHNLRIFFKSLIDKKLYVCKAQSLQIMSIFLTRSKPAHCIRNEECQ